MFNVTRLAAKYTKLERSVVKNIAKDKINFANASDSFKEAAEDIRNATAPYTKNIFKRAVDWVKSFFESFKTIREDIKVRLDSMKAKYGEAFSKNDKKATIKEYISQVKEQIKGLQEELKELIKNGKKEV